MKNKLANSISYLEKLLKLGHFAIGGEQSPNTEELYDKIQDLKSIQNSITNSTFLQDWQDQIQQLRATNGWYVEITFCGAFIIKVFDKETNDLIASTGATGLHCIPQILKMPFDKSPWTSFKP